MNLADSYAQEMYRNLVVYSAVWTPDSEIRLGDYGKLKNEVFTRYGNLKDTYKKEFADLATQTDPTAADQMYASDGGTSYEFTPSGSASIGGPITVKAKAEFKFSRQGAIYFSAKKCTSEEYLNQGDVGQRLMDLYEAREWDKDYYVAGKVVKSDATTVIVSNSDDASFTLEAKTPNTEIIDLGIPNIGAKLNITQQKNIAYKAVADRMTPLMSLWHIKDGWFKPPIYQPLTLGKGPKASTPQGEPQSLEHGLIFVQH